MKIYSFGNINNDEFCIMINIKYSHFLGDMTIAKLLNISCEEYRNFLFSNGADYINDIGDTTFKIKENCEKCIDKLKEKYTSELVYLQLTN
jgi:hypothetical protein